MIAWKTLYCTCSTHMVTEMCSTVSDYTEWNGYMSSLPVDSHVASKFRPLPTSDGREVDWIIEQELGPLLNPIIV